MINNGHFKRVGIIAVLMGFLICSIGFAGATSTDGDIYTIKVTSTKKGNKTVAKIVVTPKAKYHCNKEYPWKVTLTPTDGVAFEKAKYKKADATVFTESKVVFEIPFTSSGSKGPSAEVKMSLCDDKQCYMKKATLTLPAK